MKTQAVHIAIVLGFSILVSGSGKAADLVSEFTSTNDGWTSVSHSRANPPWPESGITARDLSPSVANGFLRIQDLNNDWQCIAAPGRFLGDWQRFGGIRLGSVTDDSPTWKNFGLPFVGDGTQQSRWVRLGDQEEQFFRIVRAQ